MLRSLFRNGFSRKIIPDHGLALEKIGSGYGGWTVPTNLIRPDWICYCGGVGEDIAFDLELIARFGCRVFAFDPTPRAIAHVEQQAVGVALFRFLPVGLWSEDRTLRFFAPRDPAHVSHSILNLQETSTYFDAKCRSLPSLMAELEHRRIDLLKVDIEGAEHEVVRSMLRQGIHPTVLCMEIDQPVPPFRFRRTIGQVLESGYKLVALDGWNFTFVTREPLAASSAPSRH